MDQIFSTDDVHPRDRFARWHEVACMRIIGHHSRPKDRSAFEADLHAGTLADLGLLLIKNSPEDWVRTPHHVAQAPSDDLFLCLKIAGKVVFEQDGREAVLQDNAFCLIDPLRPSSGKFFDGSKMLVIKLPRHAVEARLGKTHSMMARSIGCGESIGGLAANFLVMLPTHAGAIEKAEAEVIQEQTLDLIALSLAAATDKAERVLSSAGSLALLKLRAAIEARLADPGLVPARAAKAAGISVRYANWLLAKQGTSLGRFIRTRRLERCRKLLKDPSQTQRTVTEIALGWGFSDLTHFGRSFKKAYGISPNKYRNRAGTRAQLWDSCHPSA